MTTKKEEEFIVCIMKDWQFVKEMDEGASQNLTLPIPIIDWQQV